MQMTMTDIELYTHLEEYVTEVHSDGMCFVEPYHYQDFVTGLNINDSEQGFYAYVSTGGVLCFDIDVIEYLCDDFESFKKTFIAKHADNYNQHETSII